MLILSLVLTSISIGLPLIANAQIAVSGQHPHGHDCMSAGEISLNSDITALLMSSADFAFYRIVLPERGLLDVSVDPGAFDAWNTELLDSSCQPVDGTLSDNSLITGRWARITIPRKGMMSLEPSIWTLAPGSYFVRIKPSPVNVFREVFSFRTRFIPHYGHDCETAQPMKLPGTIDGQLLYGLDREVFRVTTAGTGLIRAWTTGPLDSGKAPLLRVFTANCSTETTQETRWEEPGVTTNVLAPGTYYISVEPLKPEYLGKFTLHLELIQTMSAENNLLK
jgi:hypothetical protein